MCDHFSFENSNGDHYDHLAREKSKHALFNDSPRPKWCFFFPTHRSNGHLVDRQGDPRSAGPWGSHESSRPRKMPLNPQIRWFTMVLRSFLLNHVEVSFWNKIVCRDNRKYHFRIIFNIDQYWGIYGYHALEKNQRNWQKMVLAVVQHVPDFHLEFYLDGGWGTWLGTIIPSGTTGWIYTNSLTWK